MRGIRQGTAFPARHPPPIQRPEEKAPGSKGFRARLARRLGRVRNVLLVAAGMLIALAAVFFYNESKPPPQRLTQRDIDAAVERALDNAKPRPYYASLVYEAIRPSLVRVEVMIPKGDGKAQGGVGTGVVVTDRGIILTSLHIVKDAVDVRVIFADGSESEAYVLAMQPENDLVSLQPLVIPDDLVPAVLAPSSMLHTGDEVVVVGNPFGINDSLSAGVVSGLGRSYTVPKTDVTLRNLIQFDAAVNPGNSGGPLLNRQGEVVGIVTGLLNPTEADFFIGISFAVPIETAGGGAGVMPPL